MESNKIIIEPLRELVGDMSIDTFIDSVTVDSFQGDLHIQYPFFSNSLVRKSYRDGEVIGFEVIELGKGDGGPLYK